MIIDDDSQPEEEESDLSFEILLSEDGNQEHYDHQIEYTSKIEILKS